MNVPPELEARLEALGARWEARRGLRTLESFGDVPGEVRALGGGAGLYPRLDQAVLEVGGEDRVEYLHRMLSQDVRRLAVGEAAAACLLDAQGRILADPRVWVLSSSVLLDVAGAAGERARAVLERYVIADDVSLRDVSTRTACFALAGPEAGAALAEDGDVPAGGAHARLTVGGVEVRALRHDVGARPAFEILAPAEEAPRLVEALVARAGVRPVGGAAWDVLRVEEGVPAYGAEIDDRVMPLEARLEERAISWSKGCYPGQEVVAMARYRGRPPHLLVRLALETAGPPPAGAGLLVDARPVGRLTSVALRGGEGAPFALGYVRHALAVEGRDLAVEGGGRARIEAWT